MVLTFDNVNAWNLYLNGSAVADATLTKTITRPAVNLSFGADYPNDGTSNVVFDQIHIYNRVISGAEIADLYAEGSGSAPSSEYKLGNKTIVAKVQSNNINNGTLYSDGIMQIFYNDGKINCQYNFNSSINNVTFYQINTNKNTIVCSYSNQSSNISLFINGNYVNSTLMYDNTTIAASKVVGFTSDKGYLNGTIETFAIYDSILQQAEINLIHNNGNYSTNILGEANSSIYLGPYEQIKVNNESIDTSNKFSLSFWAKGKSQSIYNMLIGNDPKMGFMINSTSMINNQSVIYPPNYMNDFWNHLVLTSNGSYIQVYENGVSKNTSNTGAILNNALFSELIIGNNYTGGIDELHMFNYVLSYDEILELYHGFNSSLNITLRELSTGSIVSGLVTLTIYNDNNSFVYTTTTGRKFINSIPYGSYAISAISDNYDRVVYNTEISNGSHQDIIIYLSNSSETGQSIFTIRDEDTTEVIESASLVMYTFINGSYQIIESKTSDISGKVQISYIPDTPYRFVVSKVGYSAYTFDLDPILFSTYNVYLNKSLSMLYYDWDKITITISPTSYKDKTQYPFTVFFSSPLGVFENYGYTVSYPTYTGGAQYYNYNKTHTGSTDTGSTLSDAIFINSTNNYDAVKVNIYYTTNYSGYRNFNYSFPIIFSGNISNNETMTLSGNKDNTFGLGLFERMLICTIIVLFIMGICALMGQLVPGLFISLFAFGFMVMIGFIPIWTVLISTLLGLLLVGWKSGNY